MVCIIFYCSFCIIVYNTMHSKVKKLQSLQIYAERPQVSTGVNVCVLYSRQCIYDILFSLHVFLLQIKYCISLLTLHFLFCHICFSTSKSVRESISLFLSDISRFKLACAVATYNVYMYMTLAG